MSRPRTDAQLIAQRVILHKNCAVAVGSGHSLDLVVIQQAARATPREKNPIKPRRGRKIERQVGIRKKAERSAIKRVYEVENGQTACSAQLDDICRDFPGFITRDDIEYLQQRGE